jgi:outer membrane protein assembly factor BamE (lipoprotein component of BamABCDE complex)
MSWKFSMHRLTTLALVFASASLVAACGGAKAPKELMAYANCVEQANVPKPYRVSQNSVITSSNYKVTFEEFSVQGQELTPDQAVQIRQCYDLALLGPGAATAPASPQPAAPAP